MIKVVWEKHDDALISTDVVRESIETSRDRLRVLANMVLSTSGLLLSACFAFLVLLLDKFGGSTVGLILRIALAGSALFFLLSSVLSIVSSLLHARFTIVTELKFIHDLMTLIQKEVRLFTLSFYCMLVGLVGLFLSVLIAAIGL
jgi:hypothetical protein